MENNDIKITIKAARINSGLSRKEVAEKLGVTDNIVATWERGTVGIKAKDFMRLCELYNISPQNIAL